MEEGILYLTVKIDINRLINNYGITREQVLDIFYHMRDNTGEVISALDEYIDYLVQAEVNKT